MTWEEVYKLPLQYNEYCPSWVFDSDNNHTLDIFTESDDDEFVKEIIDVLNGKSDKKFEIIEQRPTIIKLQNATIIIRGWGRLIGIGGLHLPEKEAAQIQDDFQKWIAEKLK